MMRFRKTCQYVTDILKFSAFCAALMFQGSMALAAEPDASLMQERQVSENQGAPESFSLAHCIETALAKNPEIAASQWDISAAHARLDAARSAYWPQVSIEGGYQKYLDSQRLIAGRSNGEPGVFDDDILRGDLVAKVTLYSGGRITKEADAASQLSEAERKKYIRTREELIYGITSVYFSILGQNKIIASLEYSKKALEENRSRVSKLYDSQKAAKVDLLRTEVRLADLEQNLIKEQNTLAVQKRILFSLMGIEKMPEAVVLEEQLDPEETPVKPEALIATALKNRPDYQAAKDRLEAQALRVAAVKAGHWPSINLIGTYGVKNAPSPEDNGNNLKSTEDGGSIGLVFSAPLFEGGRVSAKVREENAVFEALRERLKRLELQIRQETETAVLDVLSCTSRFNAMGKTIEHAKESLRIELLKYELGKGSITDVLDSQTALLQAEAAYYRTQTDYHVSIARLRLATGGSL